jgi:hypothetical protein
MKKIILLFLSIPLLCNAQISTIIIKEKNEITTPYDSLSSINGENLKSHVGQTLFLPENSLYKESGYSGFYTKHLYRPEDSYVYKPVKGSRWNLNNSDYMSMAEKYFKVIAIDFENPGHLTSMYCITLVEKESNDTIFYNGYSDTGLGIFVTLGYYEKMKQIFIGREFYSKGDYRYNKIDSNKDIKLPFKIEFQCVDISVIGNGEVCAILENKQNEKFRGRIDKGESIFMFISKERYNSLVKKYGVKMAERIAIGGLYIGMTKEMVIESWGSPYDINTTSGSWGIHEQWIYTNNGYLYFENGKLTSTQR